MAGGRPEKEIDPDQVAKLAQRFWTKRQIAAFFNVSESTINRRFGELIELNTQLGGAYLLDFGWKRINEGSDRILEKFLEKYCDFKTLHNVQTTVTITDETQTKVRALAENLDKMLAELSPPVIDVSLPKGLLPDSGG